VVALKNKSHKIMEDAKEALEKLPGLEEQVIALKEERNQAEELFDACQQKTKLETERKRKEKKGVEE
jgi:hypothetical protein